MMTDSSVQDVRPSIQMDSLLYSRSGEVTPENIVHQVKFSPTSVLNVQVFYVFYIILLLEST